MARPSLVFEQVEVVRMPGFEARGFAVDGLASGVNVVYGPNGVGKSSLARAMRALLWPADADGVKDAYLTGVARWEPEPCRLTFTGGRCEWARNGNPATPPPLVADATRYHLALHDLLRVDDHQFAEHILHEAAGGYRLAEAAGAVGVRDKPRGKGSVRAAGHLEQAHKRRREAQAEQTRVRRRHAEELPRLEAERQAAEEATERVSLLGKVLDLRSRERTQHEASDALGAFPPHMDRLAGDELETVDALTARLDAARTEQQEVERALAQARDELAGSNIPDDGVPAELLRLLGSACSDAERQAAVVEQEKRDRAGAQRREEEARADLAWAEGSAPAPAQVRDLLADGLPALHAWVGQWAQAEALSRAEEAFTHLLDSKTGSTGDATALHQGLAALGGWLAACGVERPVSPWRLPLAALGGGAVAASVALSALLQPVWAVLALGGLALLALAARLRPAADPREPHREAYERTTLEAPAEWTVAAVEQTRSALRLALDAVEHDQQRAAWWHARAADRESAQRARDDVSASRAALQARFGAIAPLDRPLEMAAFVQNLRRWRAAADEVAEREGKAAAAGDTLDGTLASIAVKLQPYGYAAPASAASARADADDLGRRAATHRAATEALTRGSARLEELQREQQRIEAERMAVFGKLDLPDGDRAALAARLERLDDYRQAATAADKARWALEQAQQALPDGDPEPQRPTAGLEAERDEAATRALRVKPLSEQIGEIRNQIADAESGDAVAAALAQQARAAADLRDERERDVDAVIAHRLVEYARRQHQARDLPAVFHGARDRFARLTAERYRLELVDGDAPGFAAYDTIEAVLRPLDALSSGTRLQLLLAVRTAFVEHAEGTGPKLPLWLDETMGNSDDGRAHSIMEAVRLLRDDGRQVFYFTAQWDEVAKWQTLLGEPEVHVVDLTAVRGGAAPPARVAVAPPPAPAPNGDDHAGYGATLGIALLDPWAPPTQIDLWYLIHDVHVLHRLRGRGFRCWGQLAECGERLPVALPDPVQLAAAARASIYGRLFAAWQEGRSRSIDAGVLKRSTVGSSRMFGEIVERLADCKGDAEQLLARITDIDGIGTTRRDALRDWLLEAGYLPPPDQVRRTREDLFRAGCVAARAALDAGTLNEQDIHWLVAHLPDVAGD